MMDEIYEFWNREENQYLSKDEIREIVPKVFSEKHLAALQIGNMNYQIENGGFEQWYDNGYAELDLYDLLSFLEPLREKRESIDRVYRLLENFFESLEEYEEIRQEIQKINSMYIDMFQDCLLNHFFSWIRPLSGRYYEINEKFLEDLEEIYFAK